MSQSTSGREVASSGLSLEKAPPATPPAVPRAASAERRRPGAVYLAIAIQCLSTLVLAARADFGWLHLLLGGILVVGLWRGAIFAQRVVLLFAGLIALVAGVGALVSLVASRNAPLALVLFVWFAIRMAQISALRGEASRRFFGLDCPACQSFSVRGASLLYGKLRCVDCKNVWKPAERHAVDVAAFD